MSSSVSSSSLSSSPVSFHLPSYFPVVPKPCKEAAAPFFQCYSEASVYDGSLVSYVSFRDAKRKLIILSILQSSSMYAYLIRIYIYMYISNVGKFVPFLRGFVLDSRP